VHQKFNIKKQDVFQRPPAVYPVVFIDAVHFSVRDDSVIRKPAAYVVLGINEDGRKEVLSIVVGEKESSKYWLSVLNRLKNRGIKDIRDMYEKSANQSARYCEETEKMARYMQQLNQVYEKMLTAMTVNMYRPGMTPPDIDGISVSPDNRHSNNGTYAPSGNGLRQ